MEPNLMPKDYLLSDKVSYRFREPERGEVIVFKAPGTNGDEYIKRIIAVPGERIKVENGKVYVNGSLLPEKYLPEGLMTSARSFLQEGVEYTVPANSYITFGDNRTVSSDSRDWGIVPKEKITGRAWFLYWPIPRMGLIRKATY